VNEAVTTITHRVTSWYQDDDASLLVEGYPKPVSMHAKLEIVSKHL
jgi:hypothetical protein